MTKVQEVKKFGPRLRELRIQAGMTQRELAGRVNVDFTYLSKIENGALPPPSEKVILQLAEVLNTDKDDLITLAGKIPSDIAGMLKDRETLKLLRSNRMQKKAGASAKKEGTISLLNKRFAKVALAAILAIVIGISIWFAAPVTDTAVAANNQGLDYNYKGEYHKAIIAFDKAIELDPDLAIAYNNRGWSYLELGQYEQAITDCDEAIELDSSLALAYSNRGLAYIRLGQYEQGLSDCNKAIELDPDLALAYSNRGMAYIELGQYEQAIADFDKAVELDPSLQKG